MTPGEFARKGAGLTIRWDWFESPFGEMLAMGTTRGLCGIAFAAECGRDMAFADLAGRWPLATLVEDGSAISHWVQAALDQKGQSRLHLMGAPFQIKVWEALLAIPLGPGCNLFRNRPFGGVAKAARAAGTAVGRNPISWLIPCHRVIRKSGNLGGYHWGLPIKRALLALGVGAGRIPIGPSILGCERFRITPPIEKSLLFQTATVLSVFSRREVNQVESKNRWKIRLHNRDLNRRIPRSGESNRDRGATPFPLCGRYRRFFTGFRHFLCLLPLFKIWKIHSPGTLESKQDNPV